MQTNTNKRLIVSLCGILLNTKTSYPHRVMLGDALHADVHISSSNKLKTDKKISWKQNTLMLIIYWDAVEWLPNFALSQNRHTVLALPMTLAMAWTGSDTVFILTLLTCSRQK